MEPDALLVNDHLPEQFVVGLARSFHLGQILPGFRRNGNSFCSYLNHTSYHSVSYNTISSDSSLSFDSSLSSYSSVSINRFLPEHTKPYELWGMAARLPPGEEVNTDCTRYRLIFQPNEQEHVVYLIAIDHRKRCTRNSNAYKNIGRMKDRTVPVPPCRPCCLSAMRT